MEAETVVILITMVGSILGSTLTTIHMLLNRMDRLEDKFEQRFRSVDGEFKTVHEEFKTVHELAGLTQEQVSAATGLGRTVIAKIEAGSRKLAATELVVLAEAFDRPVDWFFSASPPAVVSRRSDPDVGGRSRVLDSRVERIARDVDFLIDEGEVPQVTRIALDPPSTVEASEDAAVELRKKLGVPEGPLLGLQTCAERAGLFSPAPGDCQTLESLVNPYRCMTPVEVRNEILTGVAVLPDLADVLTADWLEAVELSDVHELAAFARYKTQLGGGSKQNTGEAAVLAWASLHGGVAIIDERAASRIAQRDGIVAHGSLWLVVQGVRRGELERSAAERLVDELRATDMRLPTDGLLIDERLVERQPGEGLGIRSHGR